MLERHPINSIESVVGFMNSEWLKINCSQIVQNYIKCPTQLVILEEKAYDQNDLILYYLQTYRITYIDKGLLSCQLFKSYFHLLSRVMEPMGKLSIDKLQGMVDASNQITRNIPLESIIIMLQQATDNLSIKEQHIVSDPNFNILQLPDCQLLYKYVYIVVMDQVKEVLFNCQKEGQCLISICIEQLIKSRQLYVKIQDQPLRMMLVEKDLQYMLEVMTLFLDNMDMDIKVRQGIITQIYTFNIELQFVVSQCICSNLTYLIQHNLNQGRNYSDIMLQSMSIWLRQLELPVYEQVKMMLDSCSHIVTIDELGNNILYQTLRSFTHNLFNKSIPTNMLDVYSDTFLTIWRIYETNTQTEQFELKNDLWLNFVYHLNERINPAPTPIRIKMLNHQLYLAFHIMLQESANVINNKYITVPWAILQFISDLFPIDLAMTRQFQLVQNLVYLCVQFIITMRSYTNPLQDEEEYLEILNKVFMVVVHINLKMKQQIFQLIWELWDVKDTFYLNILQLLVQNCLQNNDIVNQLGTRNIFFHSILALKLSKKYVNLVKFRVLLQICQYLCLDSAQIDIKHISRIPDIDEDFYKFKQYRIKKCFQEFFQVNKYIESIIQIMTKIQNQTDQIMIIKELIKLIWLLSEGLRLDEVDFYDSAFEFLLTRILMMDAPNQLQLLTLIFDCTTSMVSKFIRNTIPRTESYQNEPQKKAILYYQEMIIQNEFCFKLMVDIFVQTTMTIEVQIQCLKYLNALMEGNQYNQQVFRDTTNFNYLLEEMRLNQDRELTESLQDLLRKGLSYIRNDQVAKLLQNAPTDEEAKKMRKHFSFRQNAFSQYVGVSLESLANNGQQLNVPNQLLFLGRESGIIIRNFSDFLKKDWKSFTFLIEFKIGGYSSINQACQQQSQIFKQEQVIFSITDDRKDKQIEYFTLALITDGQHRLIIRIRDEKGQMKNCSQSFAIQNPFEFVLLKVAYDDKSRGKVSLCANEQIIQFTDKFPLGKLFKEYSQKCSLNVSIGSLYINETQQHFNSFQGIISNFIILDGLIFHDTYQNITKAYTLRQAELLQLLEQELNAQMQDESQNGAFTEIHYLEIDRFKTSLSMVEVKDGLKCIKSIEKINDTNFLMNMIKRSKQFKIVYESNANVKTLYSGIYCIESMSLQEIFLSLENIDIILFILSIANGSPLSPTKQRRHTRMQTLKFGRDSSNEGGTVFKVIHYFDIYNRKLFVGKDYKKCTKQYLNSAQFQLKIKQAESTSNITEGESAGQLRQNLLDIDDQVNSIIITKVEEDPKFRQVPQFSTPVQNSRDSKQDYPQEYTQDYLYDNQIKNAISYDQKPDQELKSQTTIKRQSVVPIRRHEKRNFTVNYSPQTNPRYISDHVKMDSSKQLTKFTVKLPQLNPNQFRAESIQIKGQYYGMLEILPKSLILQFKCKAEIRPEEHFYVYGTVSTNLKLVKKVKSINIKNIVEIQTRRYSLKEIGIEIFLNNQKSYFFNVFQIEKQKQFLQIMKQQFPNISIVQDRKQVFMNREYTRKWMKGDMSNFEYLMLINKFSGRSFNDLNQYPIFPWVISDYTSKYLDLNKPEIYRDLERMMGTMSKERLDECKFKADCMKDTGAEYFLYGSHYSIPAQIINQLVRIEPFTTLQTELQDGRLDQPDRLFNSIPNTWTSACNDQQDFRELIPEYYYFPEFLLNISNIKFGTKQNNEEVNHVILPPWASTCEEFISINKQALESEIVSAKLHLWINLVFGVWQQGDEAKKRDNLFHPYTYESCWQTLDKQPKNELLPYITQIQAFGQSPYQLFVKPHWQKTKLNLNSFTPLFIIRTLSDRKSELDIRKLIKFDKKLIIRIFKDGDYLILITSGKSIHKIKYSSTMYNDRRDSMEKILEKSNVNLNDPERLHLEACKMIQDVEPQQSRTSIRNPSINSYHATGNQFTYCNNSLFVAGYLSGSVYCYNLTQDKPTIECQIKLHKKRVTCVCYSKSNSIVCLGAKDHRVTVWRMQKIEDKQQCTYQTPMFILFGHESSVKCLTIDESTQCVISCDKSGFVLIHSIRSGILVKDIQLELRSGEIVRHVECDGNGQLIFLTTQNYLLMCRFNGLKVVRYLYQNIGDISHMEMYQEFHLIISTYKGELLMIQNIGTLSEQQPIICHLYQNKVNLSINTFTQFIDLDQSLVFLLAMNDGSVLRFAIDNEQIPPYLNHLEKRLGIQG